METITPFTRVCCRKTKKGRKGRHVHAEQLLLGFRTGILFEGMSCVSGLLSSVELRGAEGWMWILLRVSVDFHGES